MSRTEVAIVGGGVIGLAIAHELTGRGTRVTVLERDVIGGMAMVAFAGILGLSGGAGPLNALAMLSAQRHRELAPELKAQTGIDVERVAAPSLHVARTEADAAALRRALPTVRTLAPDAAWLDAAALREAEPLLAPDLVGGLAYSGESHLQPRALVAALAEGAIRQGATIRERTEVISLDNAGGHVRGVRLADGSAVAADVVVLATGVWSASWGERLGLRLPVMPLRGQLVRLGRRGPTLRHIVYDGDAYIAEKVGGSIAVGGIAGLTALVAGLFPSLADATFLDAWAGLRPVTTDGMPLIGWAAAYDGLFIASGHARNGIFLSPATAHLTADLILGRTPDVDPVPFSPARFASAPSLDIP